MAPPVNAHNSQAQRKDEQQKDEQQKDGENDSNTVCGHCKEKTPEQSKKRTYWIQCDSCEIWFHGICQDLQPADVNSIKKLENHGVRWFCTTCAKNKKNDATSPQQKAALYKLEGIEKAIREIQQTCSETLKSNTEQITKLKEDYAKVVETNTSHIKMATVTNENAEKILRKQQQMNEAETRKLNAIIYGIKESDSPVLEQVNQFMKQECFKKSSPPVMAMRLGRKSQEETENKKPRPIKLVFESEASKWNFVKRVNSGSARDEGIFCKIDTSQEVRNQEWALREKIRELKNSDDVSEYRIRNLHIEQKQMTGEWKPLKPVSA